MGASNGTVVLSVRPRAEGANSAALRASVICGVFIHRSTPHRCVDRDGPLPTNVGQDQVACVCRSRTAKSSGLGIEVLEEGIRQLETDNASWWAEGDGVW